MMADINDKQKELAYKFLDDHNALIMEYENRKTPLVAQLAALEEEFVKRKNDLLDNYYKAVREAADEGE
jgi:hypothetical protein